MTLFRLPAELLGHLSTFFFGDYKRTSEGYLARNQKKAFPGLLGMVIGGIEGAAWLLKSLSKGITHVIKSNRDTIASAFWMALLVGGAAALTVGLWPAALTAVVNFSVAGYSIALLFGTEFAVQVAATAGLAASLSTALVFSLAAVHAGLQCMVRCCCSQSTAAQSEFNPSVDETYVSSASALSQLGSGSPKQSVSAPERSQSPFTRALGSSRANDDLDLTSAYNLI